MASGIIKLGQGDDIVGRGGRGGGGGGRGGGGGHRGGGGGGGHRGGGGRGFGGGRRLLGGRGGGRRLLGGRGGRGRGRRVIYRDTGGYPYYDGYPYVIWDDEEDILVVPEDTDFDELRGLFDELDEIDGVGADEPPAPAPPQPAFQQPPPQLPIAPQPLSPLQTLGIFGLLLWGVTQMKKK